MFVCLCVRVVGCVFVCVFDVVVLVGVSHAAATRSPSVVSACGSEQP